MGDLNLTTIFVYIVGGIFILLAIAQIFDIIDRHRTGRKIESTLDEIKNLHQHDSDEDDEGISILDGDDDLGWDDLMTLDMMGFFDDDDL